MFAADYPTINFREPPLTITYMTIGDKPSNGRTEAVVEQLNKILIKDLNAKLDVYYISWTDYLQNYNQTLDEGVVDIDLVGTGTDWLDAWPNVVRGNFLPLSESMLKRCCPRTYASIRSDMWNVCKYKGDIYLIPENDYTQWTNHGFMYRGDIAAEAGLNGVNSWEDLTRYLEYVAENKQDMIPWDADGSNVAGSLGYIMSITDYVPIYEITSYGLWGAYKSDMKTITSPFLEGDELLDYAVLMKKWNKMGVWRSDFSVSGDNESEYISGISALHQHHTQKFYTDVKPATDIAQIDSDTGFFWFGKESGNIMRNSALHGAMAVYAGSKHPERALMVYDYLRNDETCYRLIRYGIEGQQYQFDANGLIDKPNGYNSERDSITLNFWWGRRDSMELNDASWAWDDYYKLVEEYERIAIDYPWGRYPFAMAEMSDSLDRINKVCSKYLPEIAYGRYDCSPKEEVDKFRAELKKAGFNKVTAQIQSILDNGY